MTERRRPRKNPNGAGSRAWKRPDGRWMAGLSVPTPEGPKRRWFYGRSAAEANRKLREAIQRREQGMPITPDRRPLGDYLRAWLDGARPSLSPPTYERYESALRVHLIPRLGGLAMARLVPEHIQRYYADRLIAGASPAAIQVEHAVLHRALEQATRWGYLLRNPAGSVTVPRQERKEAASLSPDQARALLAAAREDDLEALWVLALTTGMRQGELLALRWRDVDLDARLVTVRANRRRTGIGDTKGHRTRRIALTELAIDALDRHHERQPESVWIFPSPVTDQPLTAKGVDRMLARLLQRTGTGHVTFHALRHSCATLLMSLGIHPNVVKEILGHSTITLTMDTYSHVSPTMQHEAVDALESFLSDKWSSRLSSGRPA